MTGPVFNAGAIEATAKIDRTQFIADLRAMQAEVTTFERQKIKIGVEIDKDALRRDLSSLNRTLPSLDISVRTTAARQAVDDVVTHARTQRATIPVTVKSEQLDIKIGQARNKLADLQRQKASPELDLRIAALEVQKQQAIAKLNELQATNVTPKVSLDLIKLYADFGLARERLNELNSLKASPEIDLKIATAEAQLEQVEIKLEELGRREASPKVDADIDAFKAKAAMLIERIKKLDSLKSNSKLDAEIDAAEAKIEVLREKITVLDAQRSDSKLDADISSLLIKIETADEKISQLKDRKTSTKIDIDIADAELKLRLLEDQRRALDGDTATVDVTADTAAALVGLQTVDNTRRNLDGKSATVHVRLPRDLGVNNALLAAVAFSLTAIAYAAPAAQAGIVAVAGAAAAGVQALTGVAFGLSGIKDAYQAISQEAERSAISEGVSNSGVASSLRSLDNIRRANARSALTSAQTVSDAASASARTIITTSRTVEDAKRSEARTFVMTSRTIEDAQRSLSRAQEDAVEAIGEINRARRQEIIDLEALELKLRGAALSEEEAQAALDRAILHRRLLARDPLSTPRDYREADLSIKRAQLSIDQAKHSFKDTQLEAAKAAEVGVEGSDQIVSAQNRVRDANERVADAQRNLTRAIVDSDYAREQAARNTTESLDDARYAQDQASQAIVRAIESQKWAQEDAADAIADAQERVREAQASAANTSVRDNNRVKYAMDQLTPAGRNFVRFLYDELRPGLKSVSDEVASRMLPKLTTAGRTLLTLLPDLRRNLGATADEVGDLAIQGSKMATAGPFRRDFNAIMESNNRVIGDLGRASYLAMDGITGIYTAGIPTVELFTLWVNKSALLFDSWVASKRASGELAQSFQTAEERAKAVWQFFKELIQTVGDLVSALSPVGKTVIDIATGFLNLIQWISDVNPVILTFIGYAGLAALVFTRLNRGLLNLFAYRETAIAGFQRLGDSLSNAGLRAGVFVEKVTGSATAGQKLADTTSKLSNTLNKLGNALPFIGIALVGVGLIYDQMRSKADSLAGSIIGGSKTLKEAIDEEAIQIGNRDRWFGMYRGSTDSAIRAQHAHAEATKRVMAELEKQRAQMDPLSRAQSDAARAQKEYTKAVEDHGRESPQALEAMSNWRDATQQAKNVQDDIRNSLKLATEAMLDQRNELLSNIDAEIRFKDQLKRVDDAIREHGRSIDLNTEAGRRNMEGLQNLSRTAIDHLETMQKNGATVEQVAQKETYYRDQLYQTAIQIGMSKEEARRYVDQLHLVPRDINTSFHSNVAQQANLLQDYMNKIQWLRNLAPIQTVFDIRSQIAGVVAGGRADGSIDIVRMANGGIRTMPSGIANIVGPNTPTIIGDHKTAKESYIPWVNNPRSQQIWEITGKALGRKFEPMADGGIVTVKNDWKLEGDNGATEILNQLAKLEKFIKGSDETATAASHTATDNVNNSSSESASSFLSNINVPPTRLPNEISNIINQTSTSISNNNNDITRATNGSPVIGTAVFQMPQGANAKDFADTLDFELQYRRKKGVFKR